MTVTAPTSVIIADDEFAVRELISDLFKDHGFQVRGTASCLNEIVDLYKKHQPDMVTLDMRMPDGGLSAIKALQAIDPNVRIMVISGVSTGATIDVAKSLGVKAFVAKPVRWEEIDKAILALL
jgi:two-component system chemotaxis response regulator CheY